MTQPPQGDQPPYGGQPDPQQPPPYGAGQPSQYGGGQPQQYGGGQPPSYGGQPSQYGGGQPPQYGGQQGYGGGQGEPPKRKTGLIVGLVALIALLIGGAIAAVLILGNGDEANQASSGTDTTTSTSPSASDLTSASDPTSASESTSVSEPTEETSTSATSSEPTPTEETTTQPEPGDPSVTPGETFCDRFEKNANSNEFDNLDPAETTKLVKELEIFRQLAPPQLKGDYDVLIAAVEGNPSEDLQSAVTNIQDYAVENCDVTIDGS